MGKPSHLGGEAELAMRDLAEIALAQEEALRRVLPVHEPDLDLGIVVFAGGKRLLAQALGGKRARNLEIVDLKAERRLDLAAGEAGLRLIGHAIDPHILVVIGEAQDRARSRGELPAPAERGGTAVEMRLEAGGKRSHIRNSMIAMSGMSPALKL